MAFQKFWRCFLWVGSALGEVNMVLANFTTGLIVHFCRIAKSSIGVAVFKVRHCIFDTVNSLLSSQDFLYFVKDTHPLKIFSMSFQDRAWLFSGTTQFEMAWHHEIWLKFGKACILQTEDHLAALFKWDFTLTIPSLLRKLWAMSRA